LDADRWPRQSTAQIVKKQRLTHRVWQSLREANLLSGDLTDLTDQLHSAGFETNIETSGVRCLVIGTGCASLLKKFKKNPKESFAKTAHELKTIFNKSDFAWAEAHAAKVNDDCLIPPARMG
jgi:hypothetical protein